MSKPAPLIVLAGGSGFVGRHLAARLASAGYRIRILTRDPARSRNLRVLPTLEILGSPTLYSQGSILRAVSGAQVIVNLVGTLQEKRDRTRSFEQVHVDVTRNLLQAAGAAGIGRYIQVSAFGVDAPARGSHYLASKARAETLVQSSALDWTIVRPSVIYGMDDGFLSRFTNLLRWSPGIFPLACPHTPLAPVDIDDVVTALITLIGRRSKSREIYCLSGPEIRTLREIVQSIADLNRTRRWIVNLPDWVSWLLGALLQWVPHPPFTLDNYRTLKAQRIHPGGNPGSATRGFGALGIEPRPFLDRAAVYCRRFRPDEAGEEDLSNPGITRLA